MSNIVYPEIFRQIISKDNRNNLDIFDKLAQNVLNDGMQRLSLAMTEGLKDWEYQFILRPDNQEFQADPSAKYMGKAIFMSVNLRRFLGDLYATELPEEKPETVTDCDLSLIDLAGWCKLIRFRLLNENNRDQFLLNGDKKSIDSFMSFVTQVNTLRNEISHENETSIRKFQNLKRTQKYFNDLIKKTEQSAEAVRENLRNGEKVSKILSEIAMEIRHYSEMHDLSTNKKPIDKNSEDVYPAEYLYGFDRVYIAYPSCENRNYYRFITGELNPLLIRGHSNLAVDSGTVEYLSELGMSTETKQAEEAKRLFKAFDNDLKDTLSLIRLPETQSVPVHYTERFFRQLQKSNESICVITDDLYLCRAISGLADNIVAVNVLDPGHVSPFREIQTKPAEAISDNSKETKKKAVIPARKSSVYYGNPYEGLQYTLLDLIGSGGEGNIYKTDIGRECFKIYHEEKLSQNRQDKILQMLTYQVLKEEKRICWPVEAIFEASSRRMLVGYSMPDVENIAKSQTKTIEELVLLLQNPEGNEWGWNRKDLVNTCMDIVEVLNNLHHLEILVGDLNPKNILVDKEGEIFFIDTDSYQFGDYLCPVGIPEYTSPSLWASECIYAQNKRTLSDESFALGRLLYYILMLGDSPFPYRENMIEMESLRDSIVHKKFKYGAADPEDDYLWLNLSGDIQTLFRRTFFSKDGKDDPGRYPADGEWLNALFKMEQLIDNGVLSKEMVPSDAALEKGEVWKEKICTRCSSRFNVAHRTEEELCPSCRRLRAHNKTIILRVRCAKCGEIFTTNPWRLLEEEHITDTAEIICPDCKGEEEGDSAAIQDIQQLLKKIAKNYQTTILPKADEWEKEGE